MHIKSLSLIRVLFLAMVLISSQQPFPAFSVTAAGQAVNLIENQVHGQINKSEKNMIVQIESLVPEQTSEEQHHLSDARNEKFMMIKEGYMETFDRSWLEQMNDRELNREFIAMVKRVDVTRLDLRKPSGLADFQADQLLKGTGLEGLGKAFVEAEKKYQVNAYYLIAHAAWESGWGKSRICREKNNLFGFRAYDKSPYRSSMKFSSKEESIDVVAKYISEKYLSKEGQHYHGATLQGMNVKYATDQNWNKGIAKVMVSLVNKTNPYSLYAA